MKYLQLIVVIVCLVIGFFAGKSCTSPVTNTVYNTDTLTITDTVVDSILYEVIVKVPVPYAVIEKDTVFIYKDIDSTDIDRIFKDYFLTRLYEETIVNDSNARIAIGFVVNKNRMIEYSIKDMVFFYKEITNTNTVIERPRGMFAIGVGVGYDPINESLPLAGKLKYQDKKFRIYGISYNPFSKVFEAEASFPVYRW